MVCARKASERPACARPQVQDPERSQVLDRQKVKSLAQKTGTVGATTSSTPSGAHAPFRRPIFFERQWRVTTDLRIASVTVDVRCSGGVSEY
jgi:hypothetical protein